MSNYNPNAGRPMPMYMPPQNDGFSYNYDQNAGSVGTPLAGMGLATGIGRGAVDVVGYAGAFKVGSMAYGLGKGVGAAALGGYGMGATAMGIGAATITGGAMLAATYGATKAVGSVYEGGSQHAALSQMWKGMLPGSGGFGGTQGKSEILKTNLEIIKMATDPDLMTSFEEISRILPQLRSVGIIHGQLKSGELPRLVKQSVETLNDLAKLANTTKEEAMQLMVSSRKAGFYTPKDILGNVVQATVAGSITGQTTQQVLAGQQAGAAAARASGGYGAAGATAFTKNLTSIGLAVKGGHVNADYISEMSGGLPLDQASQQLAGAMTSVGIGLARRPGGRLLMAGLGEMEDGKYTGRIDRAKMAEWQSGSMSMKELSAEGRSNIGSSRDAAMSFQNQRGRIGSSLAANGGINAIGQMLENVGISNPEMQKIVLSRWTGSQQMGEMAQTMIANRGNIAIDRPGATTNALLGRASISAEAESSFSAIWDRWMRKMEDSFTPLRQRGARGLENLSQQWSESSMNSHRVRRSFVSEKASGDLINALYDPNFGELGDYSYLPEGTGKPPSYTISTEKTAEIEQEVARLQAAGITAKRIPQNLLKKGFSTTEVRAAQGKGIVGGALMYVRSRSITRDIGGRNVTYDDLADHIAGATFDSRGVQSSAAAFGRWATTSAAAWGIGTVPEESPDGVVSDIVRMGGSEGVAISHALAGGEKGVKGALAALRDPNGKYAKLGDNEKQKLHTYLTGVLRQPELLGPTSGVASLATGTDKSESLKRAASVLSRVGGAGLQSLGNQGDMDAVLASRVMTRLSEVSADTTLDDQITNIGALLGSAMGNDVDAGALGKAAPDITESVLAYKKKLKAATKGISGTDPLDVAAQLRARKGQFPFLAHGNIVKSLADDIVSDGAFETKELMAQAGKLTVLSMATQPGEQTTGTSEGSPEKAEKMMQDWQSALEQSQDGMLIFAKTLTDFNTAVAEKLDTLG